MAQLFEIKKVIVGPRNLEAIVGLAPSAPLMTSEDPKGTELVLDLMPGLADHLCLGDSSSSFGEVVEDTELAHLLEHVTVELLARTDVAGDVSSGLTTGLGDGLYQITLACPDDVLVAGALSSAVWVLQWAYSGGSDPRPDVDAIVDGLVSLVESLGAEEPELASEPEPVTAPAPEAEPELVDDFADEPETEDLTPEPEDAPEDEKDPEPGPADAWDLGDVPRPHLVR
ncbi:hypothetical protein NW198_06920 [Thermophilibacter sp. ET337]|uniref:cyanophycin synthetase family protein n=1 Tax=Thermophilibacter sp. ET337 TaxID=2973084 RepID=UPI0021ABEA79|nr:hypothetical protein [Thermophilibacter sp. ET337]MCR8908337.1 hypothetical protein [Thermophilibacter sp. ET337]